MKRHLNLYGAEFHPRRQWIGLNQLVLVWGALLALLLGIGGFTHWQQQQLDRELAALSLEQAQLRNESSRLDAELARHQPSPTLGAQLGEVNDKLASLQRTMAQLNQIAPELGGGYAHLLADLAGIRSDRLALERVQVEQGTITLSGQTRSSQDVPAWVGRFKETRALAGKTFSQLQLSRDAQGALRFRLGSQPKEKS